MQGTYEKLQQTPLLASHIIAIGMKRTSTGKIPEIEDVEAVACAVQNIYLSVSAYGLGGYWTTGGVTYKEEAKSFFNLTAEDKLLGFFYIGHVAVPSAPAKRKSIEEKSELGYIKNLSAPAFPVEAAVMNGFGQMLR